MLLSIVSDLITGDSPLKHQKKSGPDIRLFKPTINILSLVVTAHAVVRKWVLLTDPDDKMAGVKVQ